MFNVDAIGKWTEPSEFTVDAERTVAYAKATNDPLGIHLNGELAPPVFAVVPAWEAFIGATLAVASPELMPMVVHGEQDIHIHRPIKPGDQLVSCARPIGLHQRSGGTTIVIQSTTMTVSGEPVNEQYLVSFLRGVTVDSPAGDQAPDHAFVASSDAESIDVTALVDKDQTFRYAEASGDPMTIHLDEEVAKAVGLPGIIAHGLCTMAFTSWAVISTVGGGDPRRLKRLAVRFSQPVLPGQEITTRIWPGHHFETTSDSGAVVIKNGLAVIEES